MANTSGEMQPWTLDSVIQDVKISIKAYSLTQKIQFFLLQSQQILMVSIIRMLSKRHLGHRKQLNILEEDIKLRAMLN